MKELLVKWVSKIPNIAGYENMISSAIAATLVLIAAIIAFIITKRIVVYLITKLITKTSSNLDDVLIKHSVFNHLAYLAPSWVIHKLMPNALSDYPMLEGLTSTATAIYVVIVVMMLISSLINALLDIYHSFPVSRRVPIQSFGQVAKLITYLLAMIAIASLILGESPLKLFAGLGAMTAVLMLVFKDPILGFVAGIQLSYNRMVGLGDWVEIPQHNADGDILEIGLTTVKVRNFDNTITTVPTQSLISESFKNWRGMQESGGRRIKRAINIDINSVKFCDDATLTRFSKIDYIKAYLDEKSKEVDNHNQKIDTHNESTVNGRRLTNIGTFRAYINAYLKNHPNINQNLTILVRQLDPTEIGIPLQIYAFSSEKNWIKYEAIQSDIFDHLFAVATEFDLKIYQKPSGDDVAKLASK